MEHKVCSNDGCINKAKRPSNNFCGPCIMSKHRYKITIPERDAMLASQDGCCAICNRLVSFDGTPGSRSNTANIDHSHKTGKVRAILCWKCNTALGKFDESPEVIRLAAKYLEAHDV